MRAGSRLKRLSPKPSQPNTKPVVASETATGTPAISIRKKPASISSAKVCGSGTGALGSDFFLQHAAAKRGQRLQRQQPEAQRNQPLHSPAVRNATGVGRALIDDPSLADVAERQLHEGQGQQQRQQ